MIVMMMVMMMMIANDQTVEVARKTWITFANVWGSRSQTATLRLKIQLVLPVCGPTITPPPRHDRIILTIWRVVTQRLDHTKCSTPPTKGAPWGWVSRVFWLKINCFASVAPRYGAWGRQRQTCGGFGQSKPRYVWYVEFVFGFQIWVL